MSYIPVPARHVYTLLPCWRSQTVVDQGVDTAVHDGAAVLLGRHEARGTPARARTLAIPCAVVAHPGEQVIDTGGGWNESIPFRGARSYRSWRFDYERAMSFLDAANRSRWRRHSSERPSSTWEQAWAGAFGAEWVARATRPSFGDRWTQFIHSMHNSFGIPTRELRYGPRRTKGNALLREQRHKD